MRTSIALISHVIVLTTFIPATAQAGVIDSFFSSLFHLGETKTQALSSPFSNVQTMPLLEAATNIDPSPSTGGGDITIVDASALVPDDGPSGTLADISRPKNATINVYVVRDGDTVSSIAQLFDVSPNTIYWANNMTRTSKLKVGQTLTILPVTGAKHTVRKGDTVASIAKKYGADAFDVSSYNGIDDASLTVGDVIIIPDGEVAAAPAPTPAKKKSSSPSTGPVTSPAHDVGPSGTSVQIGFYIRPITGGRRSQGVHGYNAVDLASSVGTPIVASASGEVIVARDSGWNGGYGEYVVIQHNNGSQTLYGHASEVLVSSGQHVVQGQVIARVGNTGKSTGPHVHFEIRDGIRNPF